MRFIKRFALAIGFAVVASSVLAVIAYWVLPGIIFEYKLNKALDAAGLEIEQAHRPDGTLEWFEAGDGPAIVFVHGFASDKRVWASHASSMRGEFRVLGPDLPGHGGSTAPKSDELGFEAMAESLHEWVEFQGLQRFHLVGGSMGGGVAAAYAAAHPDRVDKLVLFAPYGVASPQPSQLQRRLDAGEQNPFFVETRDDFSDLSMVLYGAEPPMDGRIMDYLIKRSKQRRRIDSLIFFAINQPNQLEPLLPEIEAPTLVLLGGADEVVHPSAAEVWETIPDAETRVLTGCPHVFVGECYAESLEALQYFVTSTTPEQSKEPEQPSEAG